MLWAIFYVAVLFWLVGIIASATAGGLLHLLLVIAAVALIWDLRKPGSHRPV
ncbi:MAG: lmo0937 family membrane protein [Gemmatimonadaceae bacterium]